MSFFARPRIRAIRSVSTGTKLDIPGLPGHTLVPKETRMASGSIKRLVRDRGFGFIRDDGGQEWFFHRSSVQGSFDQLNEGQRVSFDEEPSAKGPRAGNVRTDV
jgi:CspA family cold shock protein